MLLTITTTAPRADDLGYLLHKHPARVQSFDLGFGRATVFYPEASESRCTAALMLDVDPIALVRGRGKAGGTLDAYVNDRPYVASSFLSVALSEVFGTALGGRCRDRPDRVNERWPFEIAVSMVPTRGGEEVIHSLFEPLGYAVETKSQLLDDRFAWWGPARTCSVVLRGEHRLQDVLCHLYVLIPVLDNQKHYYVGSDEVAKLLKRGESWLAAHPRREFITDRYLARKHSLVREALARLLENPTDSEEEGDEGSRHEAHLEEPVRLNEQRLGAVLAALRSHNARRVIDLGCGEGRLLALLAKDSRFERIAGVDASSLALDRASARLKLKENPKRAERITLLQGGLTYRDERLRGYDAATLVEVIEHFDPPRVRSLERVVFECGHPGIVIVTTPNREYNVRYPSMAAGSLRHRDHRFEWTREEFHAWTVRVTARFAYRAALLPIGPPDLEVGAPTQMVIFTLP